MDMSLSEAAKAVNKTKQTILNAINAGRLSAAKDHQGQWRIDSAELFRVYPVATLGTDNHGRDKTGQFDALDGDVRELRAQLDAANEVKALLARQVDDLRSERDRWRGQAEQLLLALPGALVQHDQPQAALAAEAPAVATVAPVAVSGASGGTQSDVSEASHGPGHPEVETSKKKGWLARLFGFGGAVDGQ